MDLKKLLSLLEERLVQHDDNRKEIQSQIDDICARTQKDADSLEEKLGGEIRTSFDSIERGICRVIEKLNNKAEKPKERNELKVINDQIQNYIAEKRYEIRQLANMNSFISSYTFKVASVPIEEGSEIYRMSLMGEFDVTGDDDANKIERITTILKPNLDKAHESMVAAQDRVVEICRKRREEADGAKERINGRLEELFSKEDARIQEVVKAVRGRLDSEDPYEAKELVTRAKITLVTRQKYSLKEPETGFSLDGYDLVSTNEITLEHLDFVNRKPTYFKPSFTKDGEVSLSFTFLDEEEKEFLKRFNLPFSVVLKVWEKGHEDIAETYTKEYSIVDAKPVFFDRVIASGTAYCMRVKVVCGGTSTGWSGDGELTTPEFKEWCAWRRFFDESGYEKYSVYERDPRVATKVGTGSDSTIIGNATLPPNKVVSWSIKVLKSAKRDCDGIFIGVAPFSIDQNGFCAYNNCGWYFEPCRSVLCSGPPHNYKWPEKEYGPWKLFRKAVHTGDTIGVVVDTTFGVLSYSVNNKSYGIAYEGIPLDKPLVPCVILKNYGDSVELISSEVKEIVVDSSVPVPSNVKGKSRTWDSIKLKWSAVAGASFYQVEVDGRKFLLSSTRNKLINRGFLPETEHTFRVRAVKENSVSDAVRGNSITALSDVVKGNSIFALSDAFKGNSVSEWSDLVKVRTKKVSFETGVWKECPKEVDLAKKYEINERNLKIAKKSSGFAKHTTIIGNGLLPLNTVTSWNIKILESRMSNGREIYIGIAPFDIDQNDEDNYKKCGWYFGCEDSVLWSGPPHRCWNKKYGPRKGKRRYVFTRDIISVVMDTIKNELSFALNGVSLGVAFKGIPLDKPLVPCAILWVPGDSVELDTSEAKENVVSSILAPSNVTAKSFTWDSITLTWNGVGGASFYQVEVDGSISCEPSKTKAFIARGLPPGTEHTFRVRAVKESTVLVWSKELRENLASAWSGTVKERTQNHSFETSGWEECPDRIHETMKYIVSISDPRIATNVGGDYCTAIGNVSLPLNTVTSWSIKIVKSKNDGFGIYIGVAPSDIDQRDDHNFERCGWYFYCRDSTLWSGPPHKYEHKEYGPRKGEGQYVHTGDSVGVVMDTAKGELSFALNRVNLGVAYEGIPLDKPLVPCSAFSQRENAVKLVF